MNSFCVVTYKIRIGDSNRLHQHLIHLFRFKDLNVLFSRYLGLFSRYLGLPFSVGCCSSCGCGCCVAEVVVVVVGGVNVDVVYVD